MLCALGKLDSESKIRALPQMDSGMLLAAQDAKKNEVVKIAGMLKKHPVFCVASDDELIALAMDSEIARYSDGYMITKKGTMQTELPILFNGNCILYGETQGGWNNPMRVLKKGDILDYSALFTDEKTTHTVTSNSAETTVLFIPREQLRSFLYAHPAGLIEIAGMLEKDRQRFMKLWMRAE
jgi:CRP-like cAMP-binding protein